MNNNFQCVVCQCVYEEKDKAASIATSPTINRNICKTCSRLILAGMKEIKKSE